MLVLQWSTDRNCVSTEGCVIIPCLWWTTAWASGRRWWVSSSLCFRHQYPQRSALLLVFLSYAMRRLDDSQDSSPFCVSKRWASTCGKWSYILGANIRPPAVLAEIQKILSVRVQSWKQKPLYDRGNVTRRICYTNDGDAEEPGRGSWEDPEQGQK